MRLTFLGSGDAFGSGGRFNTCFHVEADAGNFLIDCGASSLIAMRRFGVDPNAVGIIFISHLHGDHFAGLPFFILDAQFYSRRSAPLVIAGPPGLAARLETTMEALFPRSSATPRKFERRIIELKAQRPHRIGAVSVTPYEVEHMCGAPPFALRFELQGKILTYSGDTQWTEALIDASADADLLIAESLFFDKKVKWHMDYATLMAHRKEISAKRIILTHMGPDMLDRLEDVALEYAEDGKTVLI